ncbi:MAG: serine hydroxymethyltransferase [Candidatus Paceibacterota bacterium]
MKKMEKLLKEHTAWRNSCLNLIASENVMSEAVKKAYGNDLAGRYAEGLPGRRFYQGLKYFDEMENICIEAFKKKFNANFVEVRPVSGAVANLAAFSGLFKRGDTVFTLGLAGGSHISHEKIGAAGLSGLNVEHLPMNPDGTINVFASRNRIEKIRPAGLILGGSVILLEQPVKELAEMCKRIGTKIVYDGAHVFGLIFAGVFQNPLSLGADVLVASTHKTFPGPQGGIIIGNLSEEEQKNVQRKVFPGILSSHHLHHIPALYVAFKEFEKNGKKYGEQILKNSKALALELDKLGFIVLYKDKGFTHTHQVLLDVGKQGGGAACAQLLEDANIICNKNMIPGDESALNPGGLRLGVQEMTRFGMKEKEMKLIAKLFQELLIKKKPAKAVGKKVIALRKKFQKIKI